MSTAIELSDDDVTIGIDMAAVVEKPFTINGKTLDERLKALREGYDRWLANDAKRLEKNYAACKLLADAELPLGEVCGDSIDINVDPSDIPKYVRVLGAMEHYTKDLIAADDEHLMVSVRPKAYDTVTLSYKRKIKPKDKCQIKYEAVEPTKASVRRYVACSL